MGEIFGALGQLLSPIGQLFHYLFYQPVFNVLMGVYMLVHSFALAIVILTLLIRVALIPLTRAQLKSQQEMQKLAPALSQLKQQYRNDPQGLMQAQQALYREHGVSPMKGCLPLLVQMPFLYALYYSFFSVLHPDVSASSLPKICKTPPLSGDALSLCAINHRDLYPFMPQLHALPDMHFLWTSLATPDALHILPILAGVLTFLQLRMAMPVKRPAARGAPTDATAQATNTMQYMMPFITVFIGWSFPAGLALYWCISTLFSAVQQYFINGNFGSLFVGIPGMEHLVPPPKDLTAGPTPAIAARSTGRAGASAAALVAPAAPEGGLGGWWNRLRESMVAAQPKPQTEPSASGPDEQGVANGTGGVPPRPPRPAGGANTGTRDRRPRPAREGPTLVRQPPPGRPEDEIAREGGSMRNGKTVLPEEAIARDTTARNSTDAGESNGTTRGATNRANNGATNGTSSVAGPAQRRPSQASQPGGQSRPGPGNPQGYRKGSPRRPRDGRSKGGR